MRASLLAIATTTLLRGARWASRCNPPPETSGVILDAKQYGPSSVDQHATQIDVAALADAEQLLLASGGVLSWNDANPSCEVASPPKSCSVSDSGHRCGRDQWVNSADLP